MRSLKTAVKIWKKEIEFKVTTWGISPEHRTHYREMRRQSYLNVKTGMALDLTNRHRIGDIIMDPQDLRSIGNVNSLPVFKKMEEIYKKYL